MPGNPQVIVEFIAKVDDLKRGFSQAESSAQSTGSKLKNLGKVALAAAGAAGLGALVYTLHAGIQEYTDAAKVSAQTNAVIKSTGRVAGVSAQHVDDLAGSLLQKSGVDDEAIKSGENMLLTFTNIRNEAGKGNKIFDQATKATLDLSVAMGQDMKSSAILVGKALNDPIKGMTALQRVGVSFSEQQKAQVKQWLDVGGAAKTAAAAQTAAQRDVAAAQAAHERALQSVSAAQDRARASSEALQAAQYAVGLSAQKAKDAEYGVSQAAQKAQDAQYALGQSIDKVKDAHYNLAQASKSVTDAQQTLITKQNEARNAQLALSDARRQARSQLEALKNATIDTALSEEGAQLSRDRAAERLQKVNADTTATDLDRREATYQLERAERDLVNAHTDRISSEQKLKGAQDKGIQGADVVLQAQQDIAKAQEDARKAADAVAKAQHAQAKAQQALATAEHGRVDAAHKLTEAQHGQTVAQQKLTEAQHGQTIAQQKLATAQRKSSKASADLAAAQGNVASSADDIAQAQKRLTAAQSVGQQKVASTSNLLKAQKLILAELNKEYGGSAEAFGKTLPGQLSLLRENFNNLAGEIVSLFVPALSAVAKLFAENPKLAKAVTIAILGLAAAVVAMNIALAVAAVVAAPLAWQMLAVTAGVLAFAAAAYLVYKNWDDIIKWLKGAWGTLEVTLTKPFVDAYAAIKKAWDDTTNAITGAVNAVVAWLKKHWQEILVGVIAGPFGLIPLEIVKHWADIKQGVINGVNAVLKWIGDKFNDIYNAGWNLAHGLVTGVLAALEGIGGSAWSVISGIGTALYNAASTIYNWGWNAARNIWDGALKALEGIGGAVWGVVSGIGGALYNAASTIYNWGWGLGRKIWDGIKDGLRGIADWLMKAIKAPINAVLSAWNKLRIGAFTIKLPHLPDVHFGGIDLPNLPLLAAGGIVTGPTLAMLGEAGPEMVLPLGAANAPIEVRVYIGDRELTSIVRTEVVTANNRTAQTLLAGLGAAA